MTANARGLGALQLDQMRRHAHRINTTNSKTPEIPGLDPLRGGITGTASASGGKEDGSGTIQAFGGAETRGINTSVYPYIHI